MDRSAITVLLLGCGDLGTGVAHVLFTSGFAVAAVELEQPLAVRRRVAFAEAARAGHVEVEGVVCRRVELEELVRSGWPRDAVALVVSPIATALPALRPAVVVDARLAKRPLEFAAPPGTFVVALGPGPIAGRDCDAVVETLRGPGLGRVIRQGSATENTGVPGEVGGATRDRVLRAPVSGVLTVLGGIGRRVRAGEVVARVGRHEVRSALDGIVRGMLADGDRVQRGQKLGDVDPRPDAPGVDRISDKSRAVGRGVLEAVSTRFGLGS
jgi:xanthine dehydrogenase accessory factor